MEVGNWAMPQPNAKEVEEHEAIHVPLKTNSAAVSQLQKCQ